MDLGTTIKKLREQKGIRQNAFAKACNLSQTYVSQIENNAKEPSIEILKLISKKLNIPLPILFFLSMDEKDVKVNKREAYQFIEPSIKSFIGEFFASASINK